MRRPPAIATCAYCGCEFNKRYESQSRRYCSQSCANRGRSRAHRTAANVNPAPMPPTLLNRVAAHVLAREYQAWVANRKGHHADHNLR